jgi:hypothetical protein
MSIPVLIQAYDEVRRLAIAGSVVAPGDFRLKKLVPPLEQAGQKAPVFARVAEAVKRLAESKEQTSAAALLELATLVNSILYTQGETGLEGELTPLPTVMLGRPRTQASARVLKPLQEALTTTGSGRLEIIRDGYERGAFHDLRLIAPALAALDDSFAELADLVAEKILPLYGPAIVPELQARFDPRGRGGQVRRLLLMHRLEPESARPHVQRALDEGSPEVRVAAIGCLGDAPDDLPFLLEQAGSKAKDVRVAALNALARCGADEAARVLCEGIHRADLARAVEPLRQSRHPAVTSALLDEAEKQFNALITGKERDVKKLGQQNERMSLLLECLTGREDPRTEKLLLAMFERAGPLAAIKGTPGGDDVVERLVSVMAAGGPGVQSALIDAHETLPAESLYLALVAAYRSRKPAEVFALFSPYLTAGVNEKKKNRDTAWAKREAMIEELIRGCRGDDPDADAEESSVSTNLDPRWLDLAVQLGRSDLVQALAVPGHAGARELLTTLFQQELGRAGQEYEVTQVLDTMIRVDHPGATDAVIEFIKKLARARSAYAYYGVSYWVGRLIPQLPRAEALPKLEALLPTLPEKMIDQVLDYVTELKQGPPTEAST